MSNSPAILPPEATLSSQVDMRARSREASARSSFAFAFNLAAFVADDASGEKQSTHMICLLNFFDELRRKVPGGIEILLYFMR